MNKLMKWNWQHKDWPSFQYNEDALKPLEERFLHQSGVFLGTLKHVSDHEKENLKIDIISDEALKTSAIEGEVLNRDSLQSSIRKQFGLTGAVRNISPAEQGIAEMMVDLYRDFRRPLSNRILFTWHRMLTKGRNDLHDVGRYRTHAEAMQVVSGSLSHPRVHFEAPPSLKVRTEMKRFVTWFNASALKTKSNLSILTRAGIAHLYFVSVHPFEDGNGRIGRAISEKVLSQGLRQPTLIALAHQIERYRKRYYQALEDNNKNLEITSWLVYFSETILDAQSYTQELLELIVRKAKVFEKFRGQLNNRQETVIMRLFDAGPEGFVGGLSAEKYLKITHTSRATATRDLQDLVDKGLLRRTGELKSTRYYLNEKIEV